MVDQGLTGHKVKQDSCGEAATHIATACSLISLVGWTVIDVATALAPGLAAEMIVPGIPREHSCHRCQAGSASAFAVITAPLAETAALTATVPSGSTRCHVMSECQPHL